MLARRMELSVVAVHFQERLKNYTNTALKVQDLLNNLIMLQILIKLLIGEVLLRSDLF